MRTPNPSIAIIGIGCRFPGNANTPDEFWNMLCAGEDGIVEVPQNRWSTQRFYDPNPAKPAKCYVKHGGYLQQSIEEMDALFFGISPREAEALDPQQRLILEVTWEALEDAGVLAADLAGTNTGVFIGGFMVDHLASQAGTLNREMISTHSAISFSQTLLSARLSFTLDLKGPCFTVDTACSSSLVAVNQACESILHGDCDKALVGGVTIMYRAETPMTMARGQFLSQDGRSKSFDSRGDGYGRGEGAGIVLLKPLEQALEDGDRIYATIESTGVNQDGRTDAITVPNPIAQQELIHKVMKQADLDPNDIAFIEAHGTGTALGDPLECQALGAALGTVSDNPIWVGSVKANIGHLEPAAGIAGLIKAALSLSNQAVPPVANLSIPNPNIAFDELGIRLPKKVESLEFVSGEYASVNSFGYGGTNAHAILKYAPSMKTDEAVRIQTGIDKPDTPLYFLPLSARSETALQSLAGRYINFFTDNLSGENDLDDICFSAATRRDHHRNRLALIASSRDELCRQLADYVENKGEYLVTAKAAVNPQNAIFVMTGMGSQWWGMGQELFNTEAVFRRMVLRCDEIFSAISGWSILDEMQKSELDSQISQTQIAQPANFVLQVALHDLWLSKGFRPAAIVGHSVGEVSAAYVSGVLSLEDALCVSYHRSRLQQKAAGRGGMLAVNITADEAAQMIPKHGEDKISIAAINSESSLTLSGNRFSLEQIADELQQQGIFNRMLQVEVPYHSPVMEELRDELISDLEQIQPNLPSIPLYSTVTGKRVEGVLYDAEYWYQNIRQPVYFADAINTIINDGHFQFLEIGPHPVLGSSINQLLQQNKQRGRVIPTLKRQSPEQRYFYQALGEMFCAGTVPQWSDFYPLNTHPAGRDYRFVRLPLYPWQRQRYWVESETSLFDRLGDPSDHPILGHRQNTPNPVWHQMINTQYLPWLADHKVQNLVILPGAGYVEVALQLHKRYLNSETPCRVENITLQRALVVADLAEPTLHTEYDNQTQRFRIFSGTENRKRWDLHTQGYLSQLAPEHAGPMNLTDRLAQCTEALEVELFYARLARSSLQYDTAFRTIREIHRGDNQVLVRLEPASTVGLEDYAVHPALLDGAFQSLMAIVAEEDENSFMPVNIGRLDFFGSPGETSWAHGRFTRQHNDMIFADIDLVNEDGQVLIRIRDFGCQSVSNNQSDNDIDQWIYEIAWQPKEASSEYELQTGPLLLFADQRGVCDSLRPELKNAGVDKIVFASVGDEFKQLDIDHYQLRPSNDDDILMLLSVIDVNQFSGIVYAWALDLDENQDPDGTLAITALLHCSRLVMEKLDNAQFDFSVHVLTSGAQSLAREFVSCGQASVIGLARVIANEYTLRTISIDIEGSIDGQPHGANSNLIVEEILGQDDENEIAIYGGKRYVYRFKRWQRDVELPSLDSTGHTRDEMPFRLRRKQDSYFWQHYHSTPPKENEIQLRIKQLALPKGFKPGQSAHMALVGKVLQSNHANWKNDQTLISLGLVDDVSRDLNVSPDTHHLFALNGDHHDHAVDEQQNHWIFCAENLIDFARALHVIENITRLETGHWILIHASLDDSDLAMVQIALEKTNQVVATYREPWKRDAIHKLGVNQLICLEDKDVFKQLEQIRPEGFDIIINILTGEPGLKTLKLAKPFGHVIMPWSQQDPVPISCSNLQIAFLDMHLMSSQQPDHYHQLLQQVLNGFIRKRWTPTSIDVYTNDQVDDALDSCRNKSIALTMETDPKTNLLPPQQPQIRFEGGSYLITGGFGGFGLKLAQWLVKHGATHLVMVGRSGASNEVAKQTVTLLRGMGVTIMEAKCDIADEQMVMDLVNRTSREFPPLAGIFHTAAVLDDAMLNDLTEQRLDRVMGPKARGAWYLHKYTESLKLDHFVLFSSLSSIVGKPGQGNYVAANAYLDQLARYRRARGLTAMSLNWGVLADVGLTANQGLEDRLDKLGIGSYTQDEAMEMLNIALNANDEQMALLNMDWQLFSQVTNTPNNSFGLRYEHLIDPEWLKNDTPLQQLYDELAALDASKQHEQLMKLLSSGIATVMRLPIDSPDMDVSLNNFGLDSLMAIEIQTIIEKQTGVGLSVLEIIQDNSIDLLSHKIQSRLSDQLARE
ncbi:MAG: SDR family NAD(P)-dependent oxidoreductase [Gammaproteobacteria bacterium]|nr:SDR family NAD(P)-dependent oxidoreductase [Gammaproteobacteria bacterium]